MKIRVTSERCSGHGMCHAAAPDVFELDDEGFVIAPEGEVEAPDSQRDAVQLGTMSCPERAVQIEHA